MSGLKSNAATSEGPRRHVNNYQSGGHRDKRIMWVVKLGGSLARNNRLRPWIEALTGQRDGRGDDQGRGNRFALAPDLTPNLTIVPGGGPFADRVRETQAALGFDDSTAHRMAVLAMEQYGRMLAGLCQELVPVSSKVSMLRTARDGNIPVWMPSRMVFECDDIPGLWEVTSDSLAAWLAGHLGAECLILVKSVDFAPDESVPDENPAVSLSGLQERGVIDRAFGTLAKGAGAEVRCVGPAHLTGFADALRQGCPPGVKVDLAG